MAMVVVETFRLVYKDRRYHFVPLGDGTIRVERWEPLNGGLKSSRVYGLRTARWLWKRLKHQGYEQ